jgi:CHAT domain-containing protein
MPAAQQQQQQLAESLAGFADRAKGDDAARMHGLAHVLANDGAQAAEAFASIHQKTAADWNDLAAAHLIQPDGGQDEGEERWIAALIAADRALALDPHLAEARSNRIAILEHLGVARIDARAGAAKRITGMIEKAPPARIAALARQYPQEARAAGEGTLLAAWAAARTAEDATLQLDRARAVAAVVQHDFGESLLTDAVAAIDRGDRTAMLRSAHLAYRDGRVALTRTDSSGYREAEQKLRDAQRLFSTAGSPMAALAEEYLASTYINQQRIAEALEILQGLQAREPKQYKALHARIQHDLALCDAQRGHWSTSLGEAREAAEVFTALREPSNAGAAEAIVSEDYDFLGRRELAWNHGVSALRAAGAANNVRKARAILGALTRTEMRSARWDAARAIARIDEELAARSSGQRTEAGTLLRIATIEAHLGDAAAAQRAIAGARTAANAVRDEGLRRKLLSDVESAAGAIERRRNPAGAVALLSKAIDYQRHAERPLVLPELYLERARAQVSLRSWAEAEQDVDTGIAELEQQRNHVDEAELRPGLFDSSAALFHEAVSLQLRRGGDAAHVLGYIERGRARAIREQLGGDRDAPVVLADLQQHLGANALFLEYFSLGDRVVIVAIAQRTARVQTVAISHAQLAAAIEDHARLYDLLIRPVADVMRDVRTITVVPDDVLQRVPFAALFDRDTRTFLIQRHTVATAPSAGVALVTMQREIQGKPASALVFANPTIPRDAYPGLTSLIASEHEASAVGHRYPRAEVLTGDAATAERFLTLAPLNDVVHFAGHAQVENAEPGASALVCASSPHVHGALTLRQIAAMRFRRTRVVVLAACSTMRGRNAAIEGVPSLARAFVIAGVPAVVGTLWDIDDAEAAPLMRVLHDELAKGVAPAEALRTAQLAAIREGRPVEQWAAFAVTGVAR